MTIIEAIKLLDQDGLTIFLIILSILISLTWFFLSLAIMSWKSSNVRAMYFFVVFLFFTPTFLLGKVLWEETENLKEKQMYLNVVKKE